MLIEIWEKLRGYDKWVKSTAVVESVITEKVWVASYYRLFKSPHKVFEFWTLMQLSYPDGAGALHSAQLRVSPLSPIFQLEKGDLVEIGVAPANPSRIHVRGAKTVNRPTAKAVRIRSISGFIFRLAFFAYYLVLLVQRFHHPKR
ncbi:MAG TPA: hypothetical protein VF392_10430 [Terracidiphilus sp.]